MKTLFSFTKNIENIRSNLYGYQSNRFISRELIKKKFPSIEKPSLLSTNMIQSNSPYIYIYIHTYVYTINMQDTRVSEVTSAFESSVLRGGGCGKRFSAPWNSATPPYMIHEARTARLASDGTTLGRPPSREIMPHDPVIPLPLSPFPLHPFPRFLPRHSRYLLTQSHPSRPTPLLPLYHPGVEIGSVGKPLYRLTPAASFIFEIILRGGRGGGWFISQKGRASCGKLKGTD